MKIWNSEIRHMKEKVKWCRISQYDEFIYQKEAGAKLGCRNQIGKPIFVGIQEDDHMVDLITGEELPIIPTEENKHYERVVSFGEGFKVLYSKWQLEHWLRRMENGQTIYDSVLSLEGVKDNEIYDMNWDFESESFFFFFFRSYCTKKQKAEKNAKQLHLRLKRRNETKMN